MVELFPAIPLAEWADTKETFHRFAQIVGKVRLAASVRRNHWWNVPFHLTGRGLTTRPMGTPGRTPVFCIDFDLVGHRLIVDRLDGRSVAFPLVGLSVAAFHRALFDALADLGIEVDILAVPFDLNDDTPFAEDTAHAAYDPAAVTRYWQVLSQVALVLERFAADFCGKISPVHHFWHTFDIAVTRFTGRIVGAEPKADPVTREAYSWEVISAGFWFGDKERPWPAFYSYTAPEPDGLGKEPLSPATAAWEGTDGSHLAILRYDDARAAEDPVATVLEFLSSAYEAGARRTGRDLAALASPHGVTDPQLDERN
ncbi:DUF5996 family protein [Thermomonospora umbrina]|uniref:Ava_C0101 and related proteins n=1 Tax=Thermomonospora umbrina TaxID=111806 RepID=A0A3D9T201_9ACTN|nr:DUF5996 family protein [Thermomonospora umbrina]REE98784.1 hypothetical protein DFJ69_4282 [Thermomonospora umbrina]